MEDTDKPTWLFDINVFGPLQIPGRFALDEVDSFYTDDVFFETIEIKSATHGAQCSVRAQANSGHLAQQVALYTFEQLSHVLTIQTNLPLVVSKQEPRPFARNATQHKRLLEKMEWQQAFRETHHLLHQEPAFLLGLSHYHKAILTESPIEKLSHLVQAIESVARQKTHGSSTIKPKTSLKKCFHTLWKDRNDWPFFRQEEDVLEDIVDLYRQITGAVVPVVPGVIQRVSERLEVLHRATHTFLIDWRNQHVQVPGSYIHNNIVVDANWGDVLH